MACLCPRRSNIAAGDCRNGCVFAVLHAGADVMAAAAVQVVDKLAKHDRLTMQDLWKRAW
jgi:hypothetical protein